MSKVRGSAFLVDAGLQLELWHLLLALAGLDEVQQEEVVVAQVFPLQLEAASLDRTDELEANK